MLRKNYSEEWSFFRRILFRTFLVLSFLSVVTIAMSYDYYRRHPDKIEARFGALGKYVQQHDLAQEWEVKRCVKLFLNNAVASIQAMALGMIPFLFLPSIAVIASSIPAGLLLAANEIKGIQDNFSFVVQRIIPHGIFEFVAMIYASSIGIYLSLQISRRLIPKYGQNTLPFRVLSTQAIRSFLFVVIPLLLVAAVVQTFVTPK